jgi:hypothetical protein
MFEKIGPNHVRSSWGFDVSVRRHATQIYVEYREDGHVIRFDNTMNAVSLGYPEFTFRPTHITRWAPPFEGELLGQEKRKRVIENMAAALDYLGITSNALDEQANLVGRFGSRGWVWKDEKWLNG